jgi:hypothetical protein
MQYTERQLNRIRELTKQVIVGTTESRRLCNTSADKQASVIPKEISEFAFIDATSSFIWKEKLHFQNRE